MKKTKILSLAMAGILMMQCFSGCTKEQETENLLYGLASESHFVFLNNDGTVSAYGDNRCGQCDVGEWKDIIQIMVSDEITFGLHKDGTVEIAGEISNCGAALEWTDIKQLIPEKSSLEDTFPLIGISGIDKDGNVCGTHSREWNDWTNIIKLYLDTSNSHAIGIKDDGTILLTEELLQGTSGSSLRTQTHVIDAILPVERYNSEEDSVKLEYSPFLLKDDGTVFNADGYTDGWENITDIYYWNGTIVGLQKDGTALFAGKNVQYVTESEWTDIDQIIVRD